MNGQVIVLLRRSPAHPRTVQGLRAAVGYLTVGLPVLVLLCDAATPLATAVPPALHRHIETLRALGHVVRPLVEADLVLLPRARAIVAW